MGYETAVTVSKDDIRGIEMPIACWEEPNTELGLFREKIILGVVRAEKRPLLVIAERR